MLKTELMRYRCVLLWVTDVNDDGKLILEFITRLEVSALDDRYLELIVDILINELEISEEKKSSYL